MPYLLGYSEELQAQAKSLIDNGKCGAYLLARYPLKHELASDKALATFATDLKKRYLKKYPPLAKVCYDSKITLEKSVLGLHAFRSAPHGRKTKARSEIRIASLFKKTPLEFLEMIVVHELAHLKEKEHDKAFYSLCHHLCPNYSQYEFDLRLYLKFLSEGNESIY